MKKLTARIEEIVPNPDQPRTYFDAEALLKLKESLRRRQQQPITVIPFRDRKRPKVRWMINDGERRWRAAKAAGLKELWIVVDDVSHGAELHTASFAANWNRAGHTHAETAQAIARELAAGKSYEEIGGLVGKSDAWARLEHSLLKLDAELLAAMDPPTPKERRLPIKVAQALTAYPLQKQKRLWERFRTKGAASAFHHVRTAAPTQRAGSAGYDGQFVVRRVKMAAGICASVAALPSGMLGRLTREKRKQVAAELRALAEKALVLAALFDAMQESQPEEDEE